MQPCGKQHHFVTKNSIIRNTCIHNNFHKVYLLTNIKQTPASNPCEKVIHLLSVYVSLLTFELHVSTQGVFRTNNVSNPCTEHFTWSCQSYYSASDLNSTTEYSIVQCTYFNLSTSQAYNSNYMAYNSNYIPMIYRVASFMILVGRQLQVTCLFGKPRSHWGDILESSH